MGIFFLSAAATPFGNRCGDVKMEPFKSVAEAVRDVDSSESLPRVFCLPISDQLQDLMGMNMALIVDRILAKGYVPDGFEQNEGFRLYRYKLLQDG